MPSTVTGSCGVCGTKVPTSAAYCPSCGAAVERAEGVACPACRELNRATARFCSTCGAHMASVGEAERRIVTVLFADLSGFTPLTEELDAETVHDLIAGCLGPLCDCVTRSGGFVDKFIGDCVMALFGAPVAYENEEERAIRAALDMHVALADWAEERSGETWAEAYQPRLSIGINTGPVVTGLFSGGGAHNYTAVGDTVNVAARLQDHCEPGRILVGPLTYRHAEHLFEFEEESNLRLKGRQEPVGARYVLGPKAERGRLRGLPGVQTRLIGRAEPLQALLDRWELARSGRTQICLVTGPPGIGKTRLTEELAERAGLGPAQVVRGRSYPYTRATPWEPLAELLRDLYGVAPETEPREAAREIARSVGGAWGAEAEAGLAAILGAPASEDTERDLVERQELAAAVLRHALSWPGPAPRLLILEDLHWADGSTLGFLSDLAGGDLLGPIQIVMVSRPPLAGEARLRRLLDSVPDRIELASLSADETRELVDAVLGDHDLPAETVDAIVARADGMPLFVEELLKMLTAAGSLQREGDRWVAAGDWSLEVPDTIESVLSTRIDGLRPGTKRALQFAAIVGRRFWPGVLRDELMGGGTDEEMDALLDAAIIHERPDSLIPREREHQFQHLMLHEVAYEGILRSSREELHGAVARWLESQIDTVSPETDDLIAFHYERSQAPGLALPFLERGAREAMSRGGLEDARSHLERALRLCDGDEGRERLLLETERLAGLAGDPDARAGALEQLAAIAAESGDAALEAEVSLRRAEAALDAGDLALSRSAGEEAASRFAALGDISKRADALRLLGRAAHQEGRHEMADDLYHSALGLEREAGDRRGEAELLDLLGMLQVDRDEHEPALVSFDRVLEISDELEDPLLAARALGHRATALRWLGCLDEAERAASSAVVRARAGGSPRTVATCELILGGVHADAGQPADARPLLRRSLRASARMARPAAEAQAWLELAWLADGAEGRQCAQEALRAADQAGLVHVEILARARLAELALAAGEVEAAERASGEAASRLAEHGSIVGPEERVLLVRSRALDAVGQTADAAKVLARARALIAARADRISDASRRAAYLGQYREAVGIEAGDETGGTS